VNQQRTEHSKAAGQGKSTSGSDSVQTAHHQMHPIGRRRSASDDAALAPARALARAAPPRRGMAARSRAPPTMVRIGRIDVG
jgi:hypothetical protein